MQAAASPTEWRRTSPLAVLFFLGRLLKGVAKNAMQVLAPLAALFLALEGSPITRLVVALTAGAAIIVTLSILRYLFFRYQVTDTSILIRDGVFRKKQLDIKFHRVQGVNTEQNVIAKWLGLANVRFDTAGSSAGEGVLPAIREAYAHELQSRVHGMASAGEEPPEEPDTLLKLGIADLVRVGLADGRALLLLAVLGPLIEQGGDRIERLVYNAAEAGVDRLQSFGITGGLLVVLTILALVIMVLAIGSVVAAVLRFHDFRLTLDDRRLRTVGGLLTRHQASMSLDKVQRVRMTQNLVLRLFRRYRLRAQQVGSAGSRSESRSILVPIVNEAFGDELTRKLLAPEGRDVSMHPADSRFMRVNRQFIRSRVVLFGLVPLAAFAVPMLNGFGIFAAVGLLWPVLVYLLVRRYWSRLGFYLTDTAMVRRRGLFGFGLDVFLSRKVQRVSVSQSVFQRRRGFATIHIYLAAGTVRLPYLGLDDANRLRDYLLYKVESTPVAWH
ncbi:MAG: PH domain-containing protein [Woeseiaceae bacterium]|nr:PH domain-containing protein [Woeseiaceae bacterium]